MGICRRIEDQEAYFSGHNFYYSGKNQEVEIPDSIIVNLEEDGYEESNLYVKRITFCTEIKHME